MTAGTKEFFKPVCPMYRQIEPAAQRKQLKITQNHCIDPLVCRWWETSYSLNVRWFD